MKLGKKKRSNTEIQLHLRALERRDIPKVANWLSSDDYTKKQVTDYPVGNQRELKNQLLKEIALNKFIFARTQMLVAETSDNILLGFISLKKIDWQSRHLDLQIYIPSDFRQSNLAPVIMEKAYNYIFNNLNMHKIYLNISGTDQAAIKNHEKHQHQPEAILYDYLFDGKSNQDLYIYAVYKKELIKK